MNSQAKSAPLPTRSLLVLFCFAILGGLSAGKTDLFNSIMMFLFGLLFGAIALMLFVWLLSIFNSRIKQTYDKKSIRWIVNRGFLLMLPFTVLALVATIGMDWQVASAFASAGIMTSSTAIGVELARLGGGKISSSLLPVLGGMVTTTAWMLLLSAVATII
jgi:hypothetical protein